MVYMECLGRVPSRLGTSSSTELRISLVVAGRGEGGHPNPPKKQ